MVSSSWYWAPQTIVTALHFPQATWGMSSRLQKLKLFKTNLIITKRQNNCISLQIFTNFIIRPYRKFTTDNVNKMTMKKRSTVFGGQQNGFWSCICSNFCADKEAYNLDKTNVNDTKAVTILDDIFVHRKKVFMWHDGHAIWMEQKTNSQHW